MQAITTTYKAPTNHTGSRLLVKYDNERLTVAWDYELNVQENHLAAAKAMQDKMGLEFTLVQNALNDSTEVFAQVRS